MLAISVDCSCALWMIASFDFVMMSVGHLCPSPAINQMIYSGSVWNDVMLLDSFHRNF